MAIRLALAALLVFVASTAACGPCDNRVTRCLQCGQAGGCAESGEICADNRCSSDEDCEGAFECSAAGYCEPSLICV